MRDALEVTLDTLIVLFGCVLFVFGFFSLIGAVASGAANVWPVLLAPVVLIPAGLFVTAWGFSR